MKASRTFRASVGDLAARSGVPFTGVGRWQAIPSRRSGTLRASTARCLGGSDDVLAAWVLSDVSRGRSRSTSYSPLMNSRRSAFILPGSTIAIPWEPPGYTFKIA